MKLDLQKVKEKLIAEGVVKQIVYYEEANELAINEDYFIYDDKTGESDLYYISITIDEVNNCYIVDTHFAERDFLDRYDNQEEYVRNLIKEMNQKNNRKLNVTQVFNAKMIGEYMIKNILEQSRDNSNHTFYYILEELSQHNGNISAILTDNNIENVYNKVFNNDDKLAMDYVAYLLGFKNSYDESLDEVILDALVSELINSSTSCYWNHYDCKFIPRRLLQDTLYELSLIDSLNVRAKRDTEKGEYIEIILCDNLRAEITADIDKCSKICYSVVLLNEENLFEGNYTCNSIEKVTTYLLKKIENLDVSLIL